MQSQCIQVVGFGRPEVLVASQVDVGEPMAGEARVRQTGIGVNYVDVYHRTGQLHGDGPVPPFIPGVQANGIVESIGAGVTDVAVGDRVTYANIGIGSYTEWRCVPADRLVQIPDGVADDLVSAAFLRGLTCHYLLTRLYKVRPGDTILVHAAAGGVGQMMVQWARELGAIVIGTVGNDDKAAFVSRLGCQHPIVYTRENFRERVLEITGGLGVPVVYDSVGADTFIDSLACLRPMGIAINYGTASGQVPPFPLQMLHSKSLSVCRPTLKTWVADRQDLLKASADLFSVLQSGKVKVDIAEKLPLHEARRAHELIESRRLQGALLLTTG